MLGRAFDLLAAPLVAAGLPRMTHRTLWPGRLAILMYHAITRVPLPVSDWCFIPAPQFRREMAYLRRHCSVLPLLEAVERLRAGTLPPAAVAITFDDGYMNNADVALPILQEFGLPATIFLATDFIDSDRMLWFCRLHRALIETRSASLNWQGRDYDLATPARRAAVSAQLQALLKHLPPRQLDEKLGLILRVLGDDPTRPVGADEPYRMLDQPAIERLLAAGTIELGAHTQSHPILSRVGPEQRRTEIAASIADVAARTGRPCRTFAYPNGQPADYTADCLEVLRAEQVTLAVTTIERPTDAASAATTPLELGRYGVGPDLAPARFAMTVHHVASLLRPAPPPQNLNTHTN